MNINKNKSIRKGFIFSKTIFPAVGALLLATQTGCSGVGKRLGMVEPGNDVVNKHRSTKPIIPPKPSSGVSAVMELTKALLNNMDIFEKTASDKLDKVGEKVSKCEEKVSNVQQRIEALQQKTIDTTTDNNSNTITTTTTNNGQVMTSSAAAPPPPPPPSKEQSFDLKAPKKNLPSRANQSDNTSRPNIRYDVNEILKIKLKTPQKDNKIDTNLSHAGGESDEHCIPNGTDSLLSNNNALTIDQRLALTKQANQENSDSEAKKFDFGPKVVRVNKKTSSALSDTSSESGLGCSTTSSSVDDLFSVVDDVASNTSEDDSSPQKTMAEISKSETVTLKQTQFHNQRNTPPANMDKQLAEWLEKQRAKIKSNAEPND